MNADHELRPPSAVRTRRRGLAAVFGGSLVLAAGSLVGLAAPAQAATSLPCDLYGNAGSTCVASYSSVGALFGSYTGSLYQVTRASDTSSYSVGVTAAGALTALMVLLAGYLGYPRASLAMETVHELPES